MDGTYGTCPGCLGSFRLTEGRGAMKRHGFSAHFPHGRSGYGFHTGSCPGTSVRPLGTEEGNRFAVRRAKSYRQSARDLEAMPPHTREQAINDAVYQARQGMRRRGQTLPADAYQKPEDFAGTMYRGWFGEKEYARRMKAMDATRAGQIDNLRRVAAQLTDAVARARSGDRSPGL